MNDVAETVRFYARWAQWYDYAARYTPGLTNLRDRSVAALGLSQGECVVEMGCGTGANLRLLHDRVGRRGCVIGVDSTREMLERARSHQFASNRDNVGVVQGDARQPPVRSANGVLATFVMGMLDQPDRAVTDWCDLVSSGDRIVLLDATPSRHWLGRGLNPVFRAFVTATTPRGARYAYPDLVRTLRDRVEMSRSALKERASVLSDERVAMGFLRLTVAQIE